MALLAWSRVWAVAAAMATALCVTSPARAEEPISEEAKLYFRNGVDLIQQSPPNYQDAYYQFKLAYEKSKSWKVLGNLGLCAFKLERDGEALEAYDEYLKSGGAEIDPEERRALERDMLVITGNSATVHLVSDVPDAELIDVRAGTSVPPQSYRFQSGSLSLRLRAGTHTLTATAADGRQDRWEVVLSPGRTVEHRFDFGSGEAPAPSAPATAPLAPPSDADDRSRGKSSTVRTLGFVAAGVGGAALAGGVVTGLLAKGKESDATGQCNDDNVCPRAAEADFDSASSLASVSTILFIGGGVLAATGVGMIVFGGSRGNESAPTAALVEPRLEISPVLGVGGAGLWAKGRFW